MTTGERLLACGDFIGLEEADLYGFEEVHGGFGLVGRNAYGEIVLDFYNVLNLAVANTWFKKLIDI